jgi:dCMP deaminase
MGVKKVIYYKSYAVYKGIDKDEGVDFLLQFGVEVEAYKGEISPGPDPLI